MNTFDNPHLSIEKAMECAIARSYFVKAFVALSPVEKETFVAEHFYDLAIIVAFIVEDSRSITGLAYALAKSYEDSVAFIEYIADKVLALIGESDEAHTAFANTLDKRYIDVWGEKGKKYE